jgi:ribonuclease HI
MNTPEAVIYFNASSKKSNLGAAAVILDRDNNIRRYRQVSIGLAKYSSVHAAELIAIYYAVETALGEQMENDHQNSSQHQIITIVSDSKSALQAIANPSNKPGKHIVHSILNITKELKEHQVKFRLLCIPEHSGNPGNDTADKLAKEALGPAENQTSWP